MPALARVLAATDARVAATALARPCRTRSFFLPVGPLAGGPGVAGVQRGGGLAQVAGDVEESYEHRHFEAPGPGVGADGGDLLLVPVDEEHPLPDPRRRIAAVTFGVGERRSCPRWSR